MDEKRVLVKSWLNKARRDLDSARRLAEGPEAFLDVAIYHCQQTAEKALKGWLVFHDQRLEKTHDVRMLAILSSSIDPEFSTLFEAAERLTPYAVIYRYPGDLLFPELEEFRQAFQDAEIVLAFVQAHLPEMNT